MDRAIVLFHIVAGTIVLIVAPIALITLKGGRKHRRAGSAFAFAMGVVLFTAAFMWQAKGHVFLLVLDVVCAYLVFEGFRVIARRRRNARDRAADRIDLAAAALILLCSIALVAIALIAKTPLMRDIAGILIGLAAIAATFAILDLRAVAARVQTRLGSLLLHISAMMAAYISAVTAFCVINFHGVPMSLRWIVPSLIGSTIIAYFSMQYRIKFASAKRSPKTARALP
jgi:hypothetical protein